MFEYIGALPEFASQIHAHCWMFPSSWVFLHPVGVDISAVATFPSNTIGIVDAALFLFFPSHAQPNYIYPHIYTHHIVQYVQ